MKNLQWASEQDPIVNHILKSGGDATACVVALVEQKQLLIDRIIELEGIAPRKIKVGDQIFIWHCPDKFIPIR